MLLNNEDIAGRCLVYKVWAEVIVFLLFFFFYFIHIQQSKTFI